MTMAITIAVFWIAIGAVACNNFEASTVEVNELIISSEILSGEETLIIPSASKEEVQQFFPERSKGALHIGMISKVDLVDRHYAQITYTDGTTFKPVLLFSGQAIRLEECHVMLLKKYPFSQDFFIDRMAPC